MRLQRGLLPIVALLALAVGCDAPTAPASDDLQVTVHLGKAQYFEDEPIYVVFELRNTGSDTASVSFFPLAALNLTAELTRSDGLQIPEDGPVVDYVCVTVCAEPVGPGRSKFDIAMLQDRWGQYDTTVKNLYFNRHIPVGGYTLRARFYWNPDPQQSFFRRAPPALKATPVTFSVRPRTVTEDSLFAAAQHLAGMPWDTLQRPQYLSAVVDFVTRGAMSDPTNPFLPYAASYLEPVAPIFGQSPDSATVDRLTTARFAIAEAEADSPAGAMTATGFYHERPNELVVLAGLLGPTLTGRVAAELYRRYVEQPH